MQLGYAYLRLLLTTSVSKQAPISCSYQITVRTRLQNSNQARNSTERPRFDFLGVNSPYGDLHCVNLCVTLVARQYLDVNGLTSSLLQFHSRNV